MREWFNQINQSNNTNEVLLNYKATTPYIQFILLEQIDT